MNDEQFETAKKALSEMKDGGILIIPKEVTVNQMNELIRLATDNTVIKGLR